MHKGQTDYSRIIPNIRLKFSSVFIALLAGCLSLNSWANARLSATQLNEKALNNYTDDAFFRSSSDFIDIASDIPMHLLTSGKWSDMARPAKGVHETVTANGVWLSGANDDQSPRYLAGLSRFFDISHFYQPIIRNEVVTDEKSKEVTSIATPVPSHYEAYVGVAGNRLKYRSADEGSFSLTGYEIQVGARTNDYFGLEFRLGRSNETSTNDVSMKLDHMISVLARPTLSLADELRLHAVMGYSSIKRTSSGRPELRQRDSSEKKGLSYGVGLQWYLQPNVSLAIDYLNLYDDDDETIEGISVGISIVHR